MLPTLAVGVLAATIGAAVIGFFCVRLDEIYFAMALLLLKIPHPNISRSPLPGEPEHFALRVSHRGYVIEKGQIKFEGSKEELLEDDEVQKRYLALCSTFHDAWNELSNTPCRSPSQFPSWVRSDISATVAIIAKLRRAPVWSW